MKDRSVDAADACPASSADTSTQYSFIADARENAGIASKAIAAAAPNIFFIFISPLVSSVCVKENLPRQTLFNPNAILASYHVVAFLVIDKTSR
jgi:hypothetical protein